MATSAGVNLATAAKQREKAKLAAERDQAAALGQVQPETGGLDQYAEQQTQPQSVETSDPISLEADALFDLAVIEERGAQQKENPALFKGKVGDVNEVLEAVHFDAEGNVLDLPTSINNIVNELSEKRRPTFNDLQLATTRKTTQSADFETVDAAGTPVENNTTKGFNGLATDISSVFTAVANKNSLIDDALVDLGFDFSSPDAEANSIAAEKYATGLIGLAVEHSASIEDVIAEVNLKVEEGKISEFDGQAEIDRTINGLTSFNPNKSGDELTTLFGALDVNQTLDPYAQDPAAKPEISDEQKRANRALAATVFSALTGKGWLSAEQHDFSAGEPEAGSKLLGKIYNPNSAFSSIIESEPELVGLLSTDRIKTPSSSPAPLGLQVSDQGIDTRTQLGQTFGEQKSAGDVGPKDKKSGLTATQKAADYFGSIAFKVNNGTLNTLAGFLASALKTGNTILPLSNYTRTILDNPSQLPFISTGAFASAFQMDTQSLANAINKHAPAGIPSLKINFEGGGGSPEIQIAEHFDTHIKSILQNKEVHGNKAQEVARKWFQTATTAHNANVATDVNAVMDAIAFNDQAFYYPIKFIGKNLRLELGVNRLNPQSSPMVRGLISQAKSILVDTRKRGGVKAKRFKMAAVANLELVHPTRNPNSTHRSKIFNDPRVKEDKYKTEVEASKKVLVETYDLYFDNSRYGNNLRAKYLNNENTGVAAEFNAKRMQLLTTAAAIRGHGITFTTDETGVIKTFVIHSLTPGVDLAKNGKLDSNIGTNHLAQAKQQPGTRNELWKNSAGQVAQGLDALGLGIPAVYETTVAEGLGLTRNGAQKGRNKELSIHVNTFSNIGSFLFADQIGGVFDADLVYEKDGINNNFAFLGMITRGTSGSDSTMMSHSGLINYLLDSEGGYIRAEGDMRDAFNVKAIASVNDNLTAAMNAGNNADVDQWTDMLNFLNAVEASGTAKEVWKAIIMQAGYGKDFGGFEGNVRQSLLSAPDKANKIQEYLRTIPGSKSLDDTYASVDASIKPLLETGLKDLGTVVRVLKEAAQYATVAGSSVVFENYVGRLLDLGGWRHKSQAAFIQGSTPGTKEGFTESFDHISTSQVRTGTKQKRRWAASTDKDPARWKYAFEQVNGLPPLFVHAMDASTMVLLGERMWNTQQKNAADGKPGETPGVVPIFDAMMTSFENFGDIEPIYNEMLRKVAKEANFYEVALKIVRDTDKASLESRDPGAAKFYFLLAFDAFQDIDNAKAEEEGRSEDMTTFRPIIGAPNSPSGPGGSAPGVNYTGINRVDTVFNNGGYLGAMKSRLSKGGHKDELKILTEVITKFEKLENLKSVELAGGLKKKVESILTNYPNVYQRLVGQKLTYQSALNDAGLARSLKDAEATGDTDQQRAIWQAIDLVQDVFNDHAASVKIDKASMEQLINWSHKLTGRLDSLTKNAAAVREGFKEFDKANPTDLVFNMPYPYKD